MTTSWFLSLPEAHEASFGKEVAECGGTVEVVHRFSGDGGGTVHLDVQGSDAVETAIEAYRYLGLMEL